MKYKEQLKVIKTLFPDFDLIKKEDFDLFENKDFAAKAFNYFIDATDNIRSKLGLDIYFAFRFRNNFNAQAFKKESKYIIIINHSVVDQLSKIIQDSITIFQKENIIEITGLPTDEFTLKELFTYLITSYLFYHELAHILQLTDNNDIRTYTFQEEYNEKSTYDFKNHIYELDADLFGISLGTILILQYIDNNKIPKNHVILFNLLTLYILIVANIFIAFSKNINDIYYNNFSHPHPIVRIITCVEQIMTIVKVNTKIQNPFFESILERYSKILDFIHFKDNSKRVYSELVKEHFEEIMIYLEEIENKNEQYKELSRFKIKEIYNIIGA
jgi:hypothetical protein